MDIEKGIEKKAGKKRNTNARSICETHISRKEEGNRAKSTRGMPRHWEPKKDAADCEKPRGAVSRQRYVGIRMEKSGWQKASHHEVNK